MQNFPSGTTQTAYGAQYGIRLTKVRECVQVLADEALGGDGVRLRKSAGVRPGAQAFCPKSR